MALSQIEDRYLSTLTEREFPTFTPMEAEIAAPEGVDEAATPPGDVLMAAGPAQTVTDSDPYANRGYGEMKAVDPTTRQRIASFLQSGFEGMGIDRARARRHAESLIGGPSSNLPLTLGLADLVPFLGTGLQLEEGVAMGKEAVQAAERGSFGEAALLGAGSVLSIAPGAVPTAKALVKTGKAVAPKVGEMLGDYMQRSGLQPNLVAFHGTPHKFDKFDSSKIGTGEGAQAFGHGLYFAESKDVAKGYQTSISKDGFLVGNKVFDPSTLKHLNVKVMVGKGQLDEAIAKAEQIVNEGGAAAPMAADDLKTLVEVKAQGGLKPNKGRLFTVDIPDDMVSKMLDYDKPLSDQTPEIQAKLKAVVDGQMGAGIWDQWLESGPDFKNLQNDLFEDKAEEEISALLREAGIPGIRYLDSGSRATPNITDKRLAGLFEKHDGDAQKAVDEFMQSVYNTPKKKEQMREQFMRQLETPKTRNIVVFPGGEADIKILKTEGTK
jgi:hypothetical protein